MMGMNLFRKPASALSMLNVGDIDYAELHTLTSDHTPVFHPNLIILFSRALQTGSTNHLTTAQERLWNRYLYNYDANDVLLANLDAYLGSITNDEF